MTKNNNELPTSAFPEIRTALDWQPPLRLVMQCSTTDQKQRCQRVKEHFHDLLWMFKSYFSISEPPEFNDPEIKRLMDLEIKRLMDLEFEYYLALCNLLWRGWREIKAEAEKTDATFPFQGFPTSPGEALRLILEGESEVMLHSAISGGQVSTYQSAQILRILTSNAKGSRHNKKERPAPNYLTSKREEGRERNTFDYAQGVMKRSKPMEFLTFCHQAVKKRLRGNSAIKRVVGEYELRLKDRSRGLARLAKSIPGEEFVQGERRKLR
ncbi:hypothetical protein DO97_01390 [Neosynechococcus sphagnicola sy1]|uniref:Uncharacterized protein n=1 Tax=Neosynechococcus sphagnicola sy1 TaxID=1497020 RepID=A0A098TQT8_9CYAN|nr:hypothetical protein [Neosynechococcus sphagnicola]KGF73198.1 hypothetical protein DO97_01390 [Neosynechococcus sphagnicola sy1]